MRFEEMSIAGFFFSAGVLMGMLFNYRLLFRFAEIIQALRQVPRTDPVGRIIVRTALQGNPCPGLLRMGCGNDHSGNRYLVLVKT